MTLNLSRPGPTSDRASRRLHWQRLRDALPAQERAQADSALAQHLDRRLRAWLAQDAVKSYVIGVYWPIRSEPDLLTLWRQWQQEFSACGRIELALPQVVAPGQALQFLPWDSSAAMQKDVYGACVPDTLRQAVAPDLLIIPCVAFRPLPAGVVRLGYGGGFYDRTLGARPCLSWGVAYAHQRDESLQAEPHDCLLDEIVLAT
jgi:5-formyltetrahydrofolate cyclo-ligase